MPHQDVLFCYELLRSIGDLPAGTGTNLVYSPRDPISPIALVTHLPPMPEGHYERILIKHYDRLRLLCQSGPSPLPAYEYLRKAARIAAPYDRDQAQEA